MEGARSLRPSPGGRGSALPLDYDTFASLKGAARREALHELLGCYHRVHTVDDAMAAARRLMTEQRGREVGVFQQTHAFAAFLKLARRQTRRRPDGCIRWPDWVLATYALERVWPRLQAMADEDTAATALTEEWSPSAEYQQRVAASDPTLLDGVHDDEREGRGGQDPLDALMVGVLPGVD